MYHGCPRRLRNKNRRKGVVEDSIKDQQGRNTRSIALVLSLFLFIVIFYGKSFSGDSSVPLVVIAWVGEVVASVLVVRDFWLTVPSQRNRLATFIIAAVFFNCLFVIVYVVMARKRLLIKLASEGQSR